jgi:hypothetical protein
MHTVIRRRGFLHFDWWLESDRFSLASILVWLFSATRSIPGSPFSSNTTGQTDRGEEMQGLSGQPNGRTVTAVAAYGEVSTNQRPGLRIPC